MSRISPQLPDLSLVPAERLALLLRERVVEMGLRVSQILGHDGPPGTDVDLDHLPEDAIRRVAAIVDAQVGPVLPDRTPLRIEAGGRRMRVADVEARVRWRHTIERTCRHYLGLIYRLRELPPGTRVPIRDRDLAALSDATSVPFAVLRTQLWREMVYLGRQPESAGQRVRHHLLAPTAVLSVAAAGWGGLELVRRTWLHGADEGVADGTVDQLIGPLGDPVTVALPPTPSSANPADGVVLPVIGDRRAPAQAGSAVPSQEIPFGTSPSTESSIQSLGRQALDLVNYDWEYHLPGWTIEFSGMVNGRLGYAYFAEQRIEIYVRSTQTPAEVASVIAHELGHAVDITRFDAADRNRWLQTRQLDADWWPEAGAHSDFRSGAGDWAESFANWLLGDESQSLLGGEPTLEQLDLIAELVYR